MICTFFGHRDCPESVKEKIEAAVEMLIQEDPTAVFYVGLQGNFDRMVLTVL